ncbi:hypothetical protein PBI_COLTRANE_65 [Microbacterium phage Coltrane]|uniref:Uncharacterized protein n=5 Tax=Armstrongvirus armstrong TaxID=2734217 RepID=A0A3G2KDF8_9CAUD|nr:hypothetical protein HOU45_gp65 [Microbacterium phage Armstrong]AYN55936.1 hypothetical protein PBI_BRAHMS_65 [Microbacterium phage Brahms]AYN57042.1 hypothetical protein PBI_BERNSTEIN_65 [Microbacterium phage Bernstein]AYN57401.1 hypothetical protein PBI_COLTRANE_65 [Microbacterium phage Coltrane]AYN58989.1 hypothetical protein PBI_ROLLINS_65 [Microbacterium phage Rollins]UGL62032.1 hypothetical protein SEA_SKYLORD_65 [Microbacterium phage Skylord]
MAQPKFTVRDHAGEPIAGDDSLDDQLRYIAAEADGYVTDRSGNVVYDARPVVFPGNLPDEEEPEMGLA